MPVKAESTLQTKLRDYLQRHGVYVWKVHGSALQRAGMPDLSCVAAGVAVFVEVKMPGGTLSKLQEHRFAELRAAGAICLVATCVEDLMPIVILMENRATVAEFVESQRLLCGV